VEVNSIIKILSILFFISFNTIAQQTDHNNNLNNDSLKINFNLNQLTQMQIMFDNFELLREFNLMKHNISIDADPQTIWLRTSIAVSNPEHVNQNITPHFLSPLQKKYYEDSKFDPIKTILGAAQVGAVGYLAYKHIKKYGFLK